ncbi:hypothetical protein Q4574_16875 [Aliiglaciecola sp. 3_MG-2023]|uniref:hypothetical protein n=1 Tax=Aliiglaciecola sp. 3_MG-2023 TaxID=3062644 RepID=UPI0026E305CA|nr:hypothetical protein [Aliiglaciecola sp. 3_MG-2023]MDO6694974.1 hypothetical protein [Aliiglaciecola sp. 3_MG-2023]
MEPISLIAGALAAGAAAGLKDTSQKAVVDGYKALKALVIKHWTNSDVGDKTSNQMEAQVLLDNLQQDPQVFQPIIEQKLALALPQPPPELLAKATQLKSLIEQGGSRNDVTLNDAKGVQIGDKNIQNNQF